VTVVLITAGTLSGVSIGVLILLVVGIRRDERTISLKKPPRSNVEAATRRLLGVGVRTPESDRYDEE